MGGRSTWTALEFAAFGRPLGSAAASRPL